MFRIVKYVFGLLLILFSGSTVFAQTYTDEEIGFDEQGYREHMEEHMEEDGLTLADIDAMVIEERAYLTNYHQQFLIWESNWLESPPSPPNTQSEVSEMCHSISFSNTDLLGWYAIPGRVKTYPAGDPRRNQEFADFIPDQAGGSDVRVPLHSLVNDPAHEIYQERFVLMGEGDPYDEWGSVKPQVDPNGSDDNNEFAVRLGNVSYGSHGHRGERLEYQGEIPNEGGDVYIRYDYAIVMRNPSHDYLDEYPFFKVEIFADIDGDKQIKTTCPEGEEGCEERVICSEFALSSNMENITGFEEYQGNSQFKIKDWSSNLVNVTAYKGKKILVRVTQGDCVFNVHGSTSYFKMKCVSSGIEVVSKPCLLKATAFSPVNTTNIVGSTFEWDFGDGTPPSTETNPIHIYEKGGTYTVTLTVKLGDANCPEFVYTDDVTVSLCEDCIDCNEEFGPEEGERYVISAWMKETPERTTTGFRQGKLVVEFPGTPIKYEFQPKGHIIDGWQRIEEVLTIPQGASEIVIRLENSGTFEDVYFDDIRMHPFDANMKSFVYDPVTMRLMAELDANNYSTYYEYDEEGRLVRVKKETERGIQTIQESGSHSHKK